MLAALIVTLVSCAGQERAFDRVAVAALVRELGDEAERDAAVDALGRIRDAAAWPILEPALRSPDPATRRAALRVLEKSPQDQALDALLRVVRKDAIAEVRVAAVHALAALAPRDAACPRVIDALARAIEHDADMKVRRASVHDLGRMGAAGRLEAADVLVTALEREDDAYLTAQVQKALTLALGKALGANVEGWRHLLAQRVEEAQRALEQPEPTHSEAEDSTSTNALEESQPAPVANDDG